MSQKLTQSDGNRSNETLLSKRSKAEQLSINRYIQQAARDIVDTAYDAGARTLLEIAIERVKTAPEGLYLNRAGFLAVLESLRPFDRRHG